MRQGILLVEDDDRVTRVFSRAIAPLAPVRVAHSAAAAIMAFREASWCGVILDVKLEDVSGLDVLDAMREHDVLVPALVVSNYANPEFINRALDLGASYACKPLDRRSLIRFVRHALAAAELMSAPAARLVDQVARRHALTPSETEILTAAVAGKTRGTILRERGISTNTLHSQIQSLLRKLGDASLDAAAIRLLRKALADSQEQG